MFVDLRVGVRPPSVSSATRMVTCSDIAGFTTVKCNHGLWCRVKSTIHKDRSTNMGIVPEGGRTPHASVYKHVPPDLTEGGRTCQASVYKHGRPDGG